MKLIGEVTPPGDKSISHRAIMFNAIAHGNAKIKNFLRSEDTKATIEIFKNLGVEINEENAWVEVIGKGFEGLNKPTQVLNCMNSGTTARLLMGLLSGLSFESVLIGDASLNKRPMKRVTKVLAPLGGNIALTDENHLPATILPSSIHGGNIYLEVASAQVKSAALLAALKTSEQTIIHECMPSRNHSELMLKYLGANIVSEGLKITLSGEKSLYARDIEVPGDISSAAFFMVAALIVKNSEITIKNCGLNKTRGGIFQVLNQIGADVRIHYYEGDHEEVGDVHIKYTKDLKPFVISGDLLVPTLIDEVPILALLATQIEGTSIIGDASECRVKECDRIKATVSELNKCGAHIIETPDGMIIQGKTKLHSAEVETYYDHRLSMMLKVASLLAPLKINQSNCDQVSYPNFEKDLEALMK